MAMLKMSLLGVCVILLAACASNPPAAPRTAAARAASSGSPPGCVNKTATRLPTTPADCAGFGNSHSNDALKSTGQVQAQDALRMLDTSVTVGH
jgi:hypothetical protein